MVLIQRSGLSKLLEPLLFAATSDSQLSKTEISSIKINSETVPVYQLRYNGNNADVRDLSGQDAGVFQHGYVV